MKNESKKNISNTTNEKDDKIGYYLINYDLDKNYSPFVNWYNSSIYRFINDEKINITSGSKVLVKDGDYILGGFDVVKFKNIKMFNQPDYINLYKKLTDYPVTFFALSYYDIAKEYANHYVGHIFYKNFFELDNKKLRKTVQEILPDLEIKNCIVQQIEEIQYKKLLGI